MSDKQTIIKLRQQTGAGLMDIKRALAESNGDEATAIELLRKKGQAIMAKRAGREAGEGFIGSYAHTTGKLAALVVLRCETDFVARNAEFRELARNLAMQVVASDPADKQALLSQPYFRDESKTVQALLDEAAAKIGEKIEVGEFIRVQI